MTGIKLKPETYRNYPIETIKFENTVRIWAGDEGKYIGEFYTKEEGIEKAKKYIDRMYKKGEF